MNKQERIHVVVVEPNKEPVKKEIENSLETLQEIVGGYIETINLQGLEQRAVVIMNEDGISKGLEPNRSFNGTNIVGNFVIVGVDDDGDEFISLSEKDQDTAIESLG